MLASRSRSRQPASDGDDDDVVVVGSGRKKAQKKDKGPIKYTFRRIELFGGPKGPGEREKGEGEGHQLSRKMKIRYCAKGISKIQAYVRGLLVAWREAGGDPAMPPFISNWSGGVEAGDKTGEIHVQLIFEVWEPHDLGLTIS